MASIYCGGTTDDVPLFCRRRCRMRKNLVLGETSPQAHFSFMEVGRNDRRNRTTVLSGQVLDNHIQEI